MNCFRKIAPWLALPWLLAVGCGTGTPKGVIVKGKVVKGGSPMVVERPEVGLGMVEVNLVPVVGSADDRVITKAGVDGAFTFAGAGKGVKAGKYKLAVYHREKGPPGDSLNGTFSGQNSTILVDVPDGKVGGSIDLGTIDLDKPPTSLP